LGKSNPISTISFGPFFYRRIDANHLPQFESRIPQTGCQFSRLALTNYVARLPNAFVLKANIMKFFSTLTTVLILFFCSHLPAQESDLSTVDSNEDGKVTVAEFESYAEGKLPEFEMLEKFAKQVDADGNGEISATEFENRMEVLRSLSAGGDDDSSDEMPEKKQDAKTPKDDAAKQTFEKMSKLLADSKLQEAAEFMTKKAQDEFATVQVISSIGMLEMEMPMPMPQLEDAIDDIDEVLMKYGLDKLEIDHSKMFRVEMSADHDMDDEDEDDGDKDQDDGDDKKKAEDKTDTANKPDRADKKADEADEDNAKVLQALDKDGKRWEIIAELLEAKSSSPFGINPLTGKVTKFEMQDEKTAFLELSAAQHENDDGGGAVIQMVMPPTVVRMTKVNDEWKYDGRDEERSNKVMKEFMQERKERFGGGRTDF
jgi:hypothetical protein